MALRIHHSTGSETSREETRDFTRPHSTRLMPGGGGTSLPNIDWRHLPMGIAGVTASGVVSHIGRNLVANHYLLANHGIARGLSLIRGKQVEAAIRGLSFRQRLVVSFAAAAFFYGAHKLWNVFVQGEEWGSLGSNLEDFLYTWGMFGFNARFMGRFGSIAQGAGLSPQDTPFKGAMLAAEYASFWAWEVIEGGTRTLTRQIVHGRFEGDALITGARMTCSTKAMVERAAFLAGLKAAHPIAHPIQEGLGERLVDLQLGGAVQQVPWGRLATVGAAAVVAASLGPEGSTLLALPAGLAALELSMRTQLTQSLSMTSLDKTARRVYAAAEKRRYQKHGLDFEYAVVTREEIPYLLEIGSAGLCIGSRDPVSGEMRIHRFVMEEFIRDPRITAEERAKIVELIAVHEYGESIFENHDRASLLEFAVAEREGFLERYLEIMSTCYNLKFRDISLRQMKEVLREVGAEMGIEVKGNGNGGETAEVGAPEEVPSSVAEATRLADSFRWPPELLERYRESLSRTEEEEREKVEDWARYVIVSEQVAAALHRASAEAVAAAERVVAEGSPGEAALSEAEISFYEALRPLYEEVSSDTLPRKFFCQSVVEEHLTTARDELRDGLRSAVPTAESVIDQLALLTRALDTHFRILEGQARWLEEADIRRPERPAEPQTAEEAERRFWQEQQNDYLRGQRLYDRVFRGVLARVESGVASGEFRDHAAGFEKLRPIAEAIKRVRNKLDWRLRELAEGNQWQMEMEAPDPVLLARLKLLSWRLEATARVALAEFLRGAEPTPAEDPILQAMVDERIQGDWDRKVRAWLTLHKRLQGEEPNAPTIELAEMRKVTRAESTDVSFEKEVEAALDRRLATEFEKSSDPVLKSVIAAEARRRLSLEFYGGKLPEQGLVELGKAKGYPEDLLVSVVVDHWRQSPPVPLFTNPLIPYLMKKYGLRVDDIVSVADWVFLATLEKKCGEVPEAWQAVERAPEFFRISERDAAQEMASREASARLTQRLECEVPLPAEFHYNSTELSQLGLRVRRKGPAEVRREIEASFADRGLPVAEMGVDFERGWAYLERLGETSKWAAGYLSHPDLLVGRLHEEAARDLLALSAVSRSAPGPEDPYFDRICEGLDAIRRGRHASFPSTPPVRLIIDRLAQASGARWWDVLKNYIELRSKAREESYELKLVEGPALDVFVTCDDPELAGPAREYRRRIRTGIDRYGSLGTEERLEILAEVRAGNCSRWEQLRDHYNHILSNLYWSSQYPPKTRVEVLSQVEEELRMAPGGTASPYLRDAHNAHYELWCRATQELNGVLAVWVKSSRKDREGIAEAMERVRSWSETLRSSERHVPGARFLELAAIWLYGGIFQGASYPNWEAASSVLPPSLSMSPADLARILTQPSGPQGQYGDAGDALRWEVGVVRRHVEDKLRRRPPE